MTLVNTSVSGLNQTSLAAISATNWDWFNKHVERAAFPDTITCPDSTLILAGPAMYAELTQSKDLLTPIGFANEISYQEGLNIVRTGEIGSRMPRFSSAGTGSSGTIRRALFNANNLIYALYQNSLRSTSLRGADQLNAPPAVNTNQGDRYQFGMWSDMFRIPFGMAMCYRSVGNDFIASAYLEQCYIRNYQIGVTAGQAILMENIEFEIERVRPVSISIPGNIPGIPATGGGTGGSDVINTVNDTLNAANQIVNLL